MNSTKPLTLLSRFFLPAALCAYGVLAQTVDVKLSHLTLEQGLSQSTVNAIVQDARGFMWFGTQDGLNRYDGYTITVFKHSSTDSNSISDNSIWSLLSDSHGDLWIATMRGGVDRYVPSQNKFVHYAHNARDTTTISENNVISLFEDSFGTVWCGTLNSGLNRFDRHNNRFTRYVHDEKNPKSLCSNTVWGMSEDREANLWVATWSGVCSIRLDGTTREFMRVQDESSKTKTQSSKNIRTVFCDASGTIWIGTWGDGLHRFDAKTKNLQKYKHDPKNPETISSNQILCVLEDAKHNVWIGTGDAGLNLYRPETGGFVHYKSDPQNASTLNSDIVSALCEDPSGILWIGTGSGGVNILDWRKNRFTHLRDDRGNQHDMSGNDVWAILEDRSGELWVGTYGNGLNRFDQQREDVANYRFDPKNFRSLSSNNVLSLCETSDGIIWAGTEGGGLNAFNKSTGTFTRFTHQPKNRNSISHDEVTALCEDRNANLWIGNNGGSVDKWNRKINAFTHYQSNKKNPNALGGTSVTKIYEDSKGVIWVGTFGGGLHRYNPEDETFTRYLPSQIKSAGVNNNSVLTIHDDSAGVLWIGTQGGGLNRFDRQSNSFIHYTEEEGLPNNVVYGILDDENGNLWMSTNKGIAEFSPLTKTFRVYDVRDGLQGNEFNQGSYFKNKRGELFFGGINGVNVFSPNSIGDNSYVPAIYLTSFKVFDKEIPLDGTLTMLKRIQLSHAENFFSFEFVALNYTSPEKNRYMYMLEGLDKNWISASASRRYASYTNLDPGEYVLRVKGSNNDGVWNEAGVTVGISISPPYWKTVWFRLLAALTIAGILYAMYRYRVTKIVEIERIRSSIATDLHDDIGSTLTEIALYSDVSLRELRAKGNNAVSDVSKVESLLEEIGTTSRGLIDAMNDIVWAVDPKNDSFEFLLLRMKTHAARMFDAKGINYEVDIPEELSHLHLPLGFRRRFYLIFKEAVNNIIRHAHAEKVYLGIRKEGRSLVMTIVDDGKGFDNESVGEGNGLNNMKKRAKSLNGSLVIESAMEKGTTVKLRASIP